MSINNTKLQLSRLILPSFFVKCSNEKHYTSIRAETYYLDFKKQLSAMANPYVHYQRAHKKIDRTKTEMGKEE